MDFFALLFAIWIVMFPLLVSQNKEIISQQNKKDDADQYKNQNDNENDMPYTNPVAFHDYAARKTFVWNGHEFVEKLK